VFGDPGRARRKTPACTGPIAVRDGAAAAADAENLRSAMAGARVQEGFLTAASPGVISLFFRDEHYGSHDKYLFAIAEAMRHEYEAVARAGFVLQIDCPDLAMGRHIQYAALSTDDFRKAARLHIDALNHALANVPADQARLHLCNAGLSSVKAGARTRRFFPITAPRRERARKRRSRTERRPGA